MAFEIKTYSGFQLQIDDARELQQLIFSEQVRPEDQLRDDFSGRWMAAREHPAAAPIFRALRDRLAQNAKSAFLESGTAIADSRDFADAPPARPDWHVRFQGRNLGPLDEEKLIQLISRGEVPADAQVYASGSSRWQVISDIEHLRGFLPIAVLAQAPAPPRAKASSSIAIRGLSTPDNPAKPAVAAKPANSVAAASGVKPIKAEDGLLPSLPDDLKQFIARDEPQAAASPRERTLRHPREDVMRRDQASAHKQRQQVLILMVAICGCLILLLLAFIIAAL
jgi:hypothetical protein